MVATLQNGAAMNLEKLFILVILIPFAMGFLNTIVNTVADLVTTLDGIFVLVLLGAVLLAIVAGITNAVAGMFSN